MVAAIGYTPPQIMRAIRQVESNGDYNAVGDKGRSWGAYQFGRARWKECGGDPKLWGKASRLTQDCIMRNAIIRYEKQAGNLKLSSMEQVFWISNAHNRGHGSVRSTKYAEKVLAELNKAKPKRKAKGR